MRLRPRWGRIALLLLSLFAIAWTTKSAAFYYFYKEARGFEQVTFGQMFSFPLNRGEFREAFGTWQIEQAQAALKAGDIRTGMLFLSPGIRRAPGHLEGRILMSEIERMRGRPDAALAMVREGLRYHFDDIEYLKKYLRILLTEREDDELREFARRELEGKNEVTLQNQSIAFAAAQAHLLRGEFDDAEAYLLRFDLDKAASSAALRAQILSLKGMQAEAIHLLKTFEQNNPRAALSAVQGPLTRYLRETEQYNEALRYALMRSAREVDSAAPRIDLLHVYHKLDQREQVDREAMGFIREFGNDEAAMVTLGDFAASIGDTRLAHTIYAHAVEKGFLLNSFALLYIEAHLVARSFAEAAAFTDELLQESPPWLASVEPHFYSLRSIAAFGMGNTEQGQLALGRFLQSPRARASELIAIANRFNSVDMPRQALRILERAHQMEPENQLAVSSMIEIGLKIGDVSSLPQNLDKLLRLRRPSYTLLESAYNSLSSDRFIFVQGRGELLERLKLVIAEVRPS